MITPMKLKIPFLLLILLAFFAFEPLCYGQRMSHGASRSRAGGGASRARSSTPSRSINGGHYQSPSRQNYQSSPNRSRSGNYNNTQRQSRDYQKTQPKSRETQPKSRDRQSGNRNSSGNTRDVNRNSNTNRNTNVNRNTTVNRNTNVNIKTASPLAQHS